MADIQEPAPAGNANRKANHQKQNKSLACKSHHSTFEGVLQKEIEVNYALYYHERNNSLARERMEHVITPGLMELLPRP